MAPRTASMGEPRAPRCGRSGLSAALAVSALACALLGAQATTSGSRGWLVKVSSKDHAHEHSSRMLLQHEEQGHELMASWWADWKGYFGRKYSEEVEEGRAFANFQDNMRMVHAINTNASLTFWASGNKFSDLNWEQFRKQYLMTTVPMNATATDANAGVHVEADDVDEPQHAQQQQDEGKPSNGRRLLQSSWDWRNKGINTPVRNQGKCAACWVMAGIHALEASYMIFEGVTTTVQLSAQQALDCYGTGSCEWGNAAEMMYQATMQPLTTEANYPLTSAATGQTGSCRNDLLNSLPAGQKVELSGTQGYERLEGGPEDLLVTKTMVNPVVMHYEADIQFMQYAGGVYTAQTCTGQADKLNHALVAWGFDRGGDWWLMRNSWGPSWGEDGYVRIAMVGGTGTCIMYRWAFRPARAFSRRLANKGANSARSYKGRRTNRRLA